MLAGAMRPEEPVSRIMTAAVVVIDVERPVSEALACFEQYRIHHLPVVQDGRLAGMLSSADLARLELFRPHGAADQADFVDRRFTLAQLMRRPVVSVRPHVSVGDAAELMLEQGIHAVPVVEEHGQLAGIVTMADVVHGLLRGPPRLGALPASGSVRATAEEAHDELRHCRKPTERERAVALETAELLHVEERDPRFLGKTLRYLAQRVECLERVLELAERFLRAGQDERVHALLLKSIHAAKRAEERATGRARVPFALE